MAIYNVDMCAADLERVIRSSQLKKSVRACLLMTRDREHSIDLVRGVAKKCQIPLYHYTVAGRYKYDTENLKWEPVGSGQTDANGLMTYAQEFKDRDGGVIIIEDCAAFLKDQGGDQRVRMTLADMLSIRNTKARDARAIGTILVFLEAPESACHLPSTIADQFVHLEVPYPDISELEKIAKDELADVYQSSGPLPGANEIKVAAARLSTGMVGMTRSAAREALIDALVLSPGDIEPAYERLQERKALQLSRELKMNILDTAKVEEPIGLDYLIDYLRINRDRIVLNGPGRARGIILVGPPGTGKTMLARAIGYIVGLPVIEFKISSLMNSLLGETERRFSQAFATLQAMSPNVVLIDEIEKAFGDSSERDGGTMMRCTGSLLSWLSDNPYPNFIVATSNSLSKMGEIGMTMTRSERFDASFFVDVPNREARRRMLERWLAGKMSEESIQTVIPKLVEYTDKFTGADLFSMVKKAYTRAQFARTELNYEILKDEAERKRMRAIALYDEFAELRRWGQMHCDPAGPTVD